MVLTLVDIDVHPTITSFTDQPSPVPGSQVVRFSATAVLRAAYDIEASADLMNWTRVTSQTANSDGLIDFVLSQARSDVNHPEVGFYPIDDPASLA